MRSRLARVDMAAPSKKAGGARKKFGRRDPARGPHGAFAPPVKRSHKIFWFSEKPRVNTRETLCIVLLRARAHDAFYAIDGGGYRVIPLPPESCVKTRPTMLSVNQK